MSKYLDDLEAENDVLRSLLREATFEVCFPYCSSQTEENGLILKNAGNVGLKSLLPL